MSDPTAPRLVVAFDLDMTLIDTARGFASTLTALGGELGVDLPVEEMSARLGPPLDMLLAGHLADEAIAPAVDRFRELYVDHAIALRWRPSTAPSSRSPQSAVTAAGSWW